MRKTWISLLSLVSWGHPMDVDVQFSAQTGATITVSQVPAKEPLGAVRLRLRLRPKAGVQSVTSNTPVLGPWSQVMPEVRRTGESVTIWAIAPNLGQCLDPGALVVARLNRSS